MPLDRAESTVNAGAACRDTAVIGASMGGLHALRAVIGGLPADYRGSIFVVQHIVADQPSSLPELLQAVTALRVELVQEPSAIVGGRVYVAAPDRHMIVWGDRVLPTAEPRENRTRPSINPLFRTAAASRGSRTVGVLLTGRLDDGVAGLAAIKRCGGLALVQDPADAEYPEMPRRALEAVAADGVLPAAAMAPALAKLATETAPPANVPHDLLVEARLSLPRGSSAEQIAAIGEQTLISCPSCAGPLWKVGESPADVYRCSIGHALSPSTLLAAQSEEIERALWTAVRTLEERASVLTTIAGRIDERGYFGSGRERSAALEANEQAQQLRNVLASARPPGGETTSATSPTEQRSFN